MGVIRRGSFSLLHLYVAVVVAFLFAPLVLLVIFSFNQTQSLAFPIEGLSLRWYSSLDSTPDVGDAAVRSIELALIAAVGSTLAGTLAAIGITRFPFRGVRAVGAAILIPAALPELVIGVALLTLYVKLGVRLSLWTAAVGHVLYTLPFVYLLAYARLAKSDPLLEEVARDLGASPLQAFRLVTLPVIRPAIIAGALVAVALSWDEFFISIFTVGNDVTMPVLIWTKIRRAIDPSVNAISTCLLAASLILIIVATVVNRRRNA